MTPFTSRKFPARFVGRLLALALGAGAALSARADADVLWRLVSQQCVPHAQAGGAPAPCAEVDLSHGVERGYAVLKDLRGDLQFLLIPTARVPGIESPLLLQADAPPYWAAAWTARRHMAERFGAPVPRDRVSLTVNSVGARSQNQLHIHVSCVRRDLRARLLAAQAEIGPEWAPLARGWMGHAWRARRVVGADLEGVDLFRLAAGGLPGAGNHMEEMTLAVVAATFADGREGFFLLADRADPAHGDRGSAEEDVQDHDCAVLR